MGRILGKITKRLFPTGKETPSDIPRSFKPDPKRGKAPQDIEFPAHRKKGKK